jgi:hypothetical protein
VGGRPGEKGQGTREGGTANSDPALIIIFIIITVNAVTADYPSPQTRRPTSPPPHLPPSTRSLSQGGETRNSNKEKRPKHPPRRNRKLKRMPQLILRRRKVQRRRSLQHRSRIALVRLPLREEGLKERVRHGRRGWCEFACLSFVSFLFLFALPPLSLHSPPKKKVGRERATPERNIHREK